MHSEISKFSFHERPVGGWVVGEPDISLYYLARIIFVKKLTKSKLAVLVYTWKWCTYSVSLLRDLCNLIKEVITINFTDHCYLLTPLMKCAFGMCRIRVYYFFCPTDISNKIEKEYIFEIASKYFEHDTDSSLVFLFYEHHTDILRSYF